MWRPEEVTVVALTYGNHCDLIERCLESIWRAVPPHTLPCIVGANAASKNTLEYLRKHRRSGAIDALAVSDRNLGKNPMMRRLFDKVQTPLVWWFDDDTFLRRADVLEVFLNAVNGSDPSVAMWGRLAFVRHVTDFGEPEASLNFVRSASWYRGLPPPSWRPGGKGVFRFEGKESGDGRWFFATGGVWMARMDRLRQIRWPDPRLFRLAEDVMLGEAMRQNRWTVRGIDCGGIAISASERRGSDPDILGFIDEGKETVVFE